MFRSEELGFFVEIFYFLVFWLTIHVLCILCHYRYYFGQIQVPILATNHMNGRAANSRRTIWNMNSMGGPAANGTKRRTRISMVIMFFPKVTIFIQFSAGSNRSLQLKSRFLPPSNSQASHNNYRS